MMRVAVVFGFLFALSGGALAQDAPLPQRVELAYQAYEAALASEDYPGASLAAEAAFAAAREFGLPDDLQLTLGLNALAMAPSRGTGSGLVELTRATAAVAGTAPPELAFDVWMRGVLAAYRSGDRVALQTLRTDQMAWLVEVEYADLSRLNEFPIQPRREALPPEWLELALASLAAARSSGDPVAIANAILDLQDDAVARQDWEAALALLQTGLRAASGGDAEAQYARGALVERLADLLRDGYADTSSGEARLDRDVAGLWCDHLARHPIPYDFRIETRVPMNAITRLQTAVFMTPFTVPAAGGVPVLGETRASAGRVDSLRAASREHLARIEFRPACAGASGAIGGIEFEGFFMPPIRHARGGGDVLSYRSLLGFTAAH